MFALPPSRPVSGMSDLAWKESGLHDPILASVLVVHRDRPDWIGGAVDSVLAQTVEGVEVIIVDDGSTTAGSHDALDAAGSLDGVRIARVTQGGSAHARNVGLGLAAGRLVVILGEGGTLRATFVEKCAWALECHRDCAFVFAGVPGHGEREAPTTGHFDAAGLLKRNTVPSTVLMQAEAVKAVGGWDESVPVGFDEWDLWLAFLERGWKGKVIPERLVIESRPGDNRPKTIPADVMQRLRGKHRHLFAPAHTIALSIRAGVSRLQRKGASVLARCAKTHSAATFATSLLEAASRRFERTHTPMARGVPWNHRQGIEAKSVSERPAAAPRGEGVTRVLFVTPWMVMGGAEKVELDLAAHLDKRRHQVVVVTTLRHEHPWQGRFERVTRAVYHAANFVPPSRVTDFLEYVVARHRIDIVQIRNSAPGYDAVNRLRARFSRLRVVDLLHAENPPTDYLEYARTSGAVLDARIVITEHLKRRLCDLYGEAADRVFVIRNGVDADDLRRRAAGTRIRENLFGKSNVRVVGFVGRFNHLKRPQLFVRIAERVAGEMNVGRARFVMTGDGELAETTRRLVRSLRLGRCVRFLPEMEDISRVLAACDLIMLPSRREGMSMVALEAMALGVPVVATDVGGMAELVDPECGALLPADGRERESFAQAVRRLVEDDNLRARLGTAGRAKVDAEFTAKRMASEYARVWDVVLGRSER